MKILVNASLIREKATWFEFYPIYINGELDTNSPKLFKQILSNKSNHTSFVSFDAIEKKIGNEKTIIFTIPNKLSGEYNAYKIINKNPNITIISGEALIANLTQVAEIIKKYPEDPEAIKKNIEILNQEIKMHALIWNLTHLPKKGRLQFLLKIFLQKVGLKILLQWKNNQWEKNKFGRNGWKLIENELINKKELTFVTANLDEPYLLQLVQKCKNHFPHLKISLQQMTNAMIVHVGKSFLAFY